MSVNITVSLCFISMHLKRQWKRGGRRVILPAVDDVDDIDDVDDVDNVDDVDDVDDDDDVDDVDYVDDQ